VTATDLGTITMIQGFGFSFRKPGLFQEGSGEVTGERGGASTGVGADLMPDQRCGVQRSRRQPLPLHILIGRGEERRRRKDHGCLVRTY